MTYPSEALVPWEGDLECWRMYGESQMRLTEYPQLADIIVGVTTLEVWQLVLRTTSGDLLVGDRAR